MSVALAPLASPGRPRQNSKIFFQLPPSRSSSILFGDTFGTKSDYSLGMNYRARMSYIGGDGGASPTNTSSVDDDDDDGNEETSPEEDEQKSFPMLQLTPPDVMFINRRRASRMVANDKITGVRGIQYSNKELLKLVEDNSLKSPKANTPKPIVRTLEDFSSVALTPTNKKTPYTPKSKMTTQALNDLLGVPPSKNKGSSKSRASTAPTLPSANVNNMKDVHQPLLFSTISLPGASNPNQNSQLRSPSPDSPQKFKPRNILSKVSRPSQILKRNCDVKGQVLKNNITSGLLSTGIEQVLYGQFSKALVLNRSSNEHSGTGGLNNGGGGAGNEKEYVNPIHNRMNNTSSSPNTTASRTVTLQAASPIKPATTPTATDKKNTASFPLTPLLADLKKKSKSQKKITVNAEWSYVEQAGCGFYVSCVSGLAVAERPLGFTGPGGNSVDDNEDESMDDSDADSHSNSGTESESEGGDSSDLTPKMKKKQKDLATGSLIYDLSVNDPTYFYKSKNGEGVKGGMKGEFRRVMGYLEGASSSWE